ncbi:MAG: hypothetical protein HY081_07310 [Gammaproteobacteria bacterium]|nr:hypothetical protein [Gammaproteobacteria bacterium]
MISDLGLKQICIPFKQAFRHASAERSETSALWVEAISKRGTIGYGESCPRSYVTGETFDTAGKFFSRHQSALCQIHDLTSLRAWVETHADELNTNPAAWCAIELAILDLFAKENNQTIEAYLSLPSLSGRFHYSAVLGDAGSDAFQAGAEQYRRHGFTDFKLKLSGNLEHDREKITVLKSWDIDSLRVRVDANNLWRTADQAIAFLRALDYPFFGIEEPLHPNQYSELVRVAEALNSKIILDESFLRIDQLSSLRNTARLWIINLRVSKMGGLLRSLRIVEAARALNISLIVGAQVGETSLLTRAGITIAHAARDMLIAQEGAFGTFLLERDICDPPLMFGVGGALDSANYPSLHEPGFGLILTLDANFISNMG